MIETLMIYALGFLTAALFALLIVPAVNARAERLARRRLEALFPLSLEELAAEKDHLRAELAVRERRMEQRLEEIRASKHADMEELGRRALRITALDEDLAARDTRIGDLEGDLARTRATLATTSADLEGTRASLAGTRETLGALEAAHRSTLADLETTRLALEESQAALARTRTARDALEAALAAREADHADLLRRHDEALSDNDTKRITISDLETRLATQTARGDEFERAVSDRRNELSAERQRLADAARTLVGEQERSLVLEQRIRALEAERDARERDLAAVKSAAEEAGAKISALEAAQQARLDAMTGLEERLAHADRARLAAEAGGKRADRDHDEALRRMGEELSIAKATRATLEGQLLAAREERARLLAEVGALKVAMKTPVGRGRKASGPDRAGEAGPGGKAQADLLRRIDELADAMLRLSEPPPSAASPQRKASAG